MRMSRRIDGPQMVAVVVELDCIPINDDISISKQAQGNLIDEIRVFVLHKF